MKNKNLKFALVAVAVFVVIAILSAVLIFTITVSTQNKAINLEEQVNESVSAIEVQEKRRVDLILNLVDTVKNYDKYEGDTLVNLAHARSEAQGGDVENAQMTLNAVTEAYPELKSQENYKALMNELSVTENLIAEQRDNFNRQVKSYNKYIRKFPSSFVLPITGYEKQEFTYLEYEASSDSPTNLFGDKEGE